MKIFELYDDLLGETISYHTTVKGAIIAASNHLGKLAEPLEHDYVGASTVDFKLLYRIKNIEVKE